MHPFIDSLDRINALIDQLNYIAQNPTNHDDKNIMTVVNKVADELNTLKGEKPPTDQPTKDRMIATLARLEILDTLLKSSKENTRTEIMHVLQRIKATKSYK